MLILQHCIFVKATLILQPKCYVDTSPADNAEITPNDVILSFNGTLIENDDHLANLVSLTPVGNKVSLLLLRDRKPLRVEVQLSRRPVNDD